MRLTFCVSLAFWNVVTSKIPPLKPNQLNIRRLQSIEKVMAGRWVLGIDSRREEG